MSNIYELTGKHAMVQELIEQGELDPQMLQDTLEGIEGEIEVKADNTAKVIKNLTKDVEGLKVESKRINDKKRGIETNVKALKVNLENAMVALDKKKFKTDLFSFGIQKNKASVVVEDEGSFTKCHFMNMLATFSESLNDLENGRLTEEQANILYDEIIDQASSIHNISITLEPDKKAMYDWMKNDNEIEGAKLVQSESLRIR